MLVFDNSVLSAFVQLNLLDKLKALIQLGAISSEVYVEYSEKWQAKIPNWIEIIAPTEKGLELTISPSLSSADVSTPLLALEIKGILASDDRELRKHARLLNIKITGSLGLLKTMYQKGIIESKKKYIRCLEILMEDVYISKELYNWALEV